MYFVIFNFFPHFKNNFVITIICYEMLFRTILAPTVLAVSLDRWHAECCETSVVENYPGLQKTQAFI